MLEERILELVQPIQTVQWRVFVDFPYPRKYSSINNRFKEISDDNFSWKAHLHTATFEKPGSNRKDHKSTQAKYENLDRLIVRIHVFNDTSPLILSILQQLKMHWTLYNLMLIYSIIDKQVLSIRFTIYISLSIFRKDVVIFWWTIRNLRGLRHVIRYCYWYRGYWCLNMRICRIWTLSFDIMVCL